MCVCVCARARAKFRLVQCLGFRVQGLGSGSGSGSGLGSDSGSGQANGGLGSTRKRGLPIPQRKRDSQTCGLHDLDPAPCARDADGLLKVPRQQVARQPLVDRDAVAQLGRMVRGDPEGTAREGELSWPARQ